MQNDSVVKPDFSKSELLPAIVQDVNTRAVLMLGYLNEEAFKTTLETRKVTFFSRSKNRLWMKGESSGNILHLKTWYLDCDADTLLFLVEPTGPVCHTGNDTCFSQPNQYPSFLPVLEKIIQNRKSEGQSNSYTASLFAKGINKIAQKVGEEAVELVIEAKDDNKDLFVNEAADLLFHYLILLSAKNSSIDEVLRILENRHKVQINHK
ncbi:MAG: bifunctional phosphoribosyl-AMP cyclohydrolase/phosphoribosyl-ATP diphosphatase HisIE [Bacteroidetes bacterium]|nr:bifunctional phosphoribosyl-AMP cyclohydrolase/phosphoribosyl-ATP diphosphatase HisIE [Bacteroidota bacterium]